VRGEHTDMEWRRRGKGDDDDLRRTRSICHCGPGKVARWGAATTA
jgi:hypothetical protein